MGAQYQFARLKQIFKELSEYTIPNEDCANADYIKELRQEAKEVIEDIEKSYSRLSMDLLDKGRNG